MVAADHAATLQCSQAAVAGRDAEPDAFGEFGEGKPPVQLELGKDLPINIVHEQILAQMASCRGRLETRLGSFPT